MAVAVLVLGGCSRTPSQDDRGPQERLLQSFLEKGSEASNSLEFDARSAACAAAAIVRDLGAARLQQLGLDVPSGEGPELTEPPLSTEEADAVYAAFAGCIDLVDQIGATISRDRGMPDDVAECVASAYVESGVLREALLADGFDGTLNSRIDSVLADAEQACSAT